MYAVCAGQMTRASYVKSESPSIINSLNRPPPFFISIKESNGIYLYVCMIPYSSWLCQFAHPHCWTLIVGAAVICSGIIFVCFVFVSVGVAMNFHDVVNKGGCHCAHLCLEI